MNLRNTSTPISVPFDSLTLRAVVTELRARLIGGRIQDVRQPTPTDLLIAIRRQGKNLLLLLSADARFARAHLTAHLPPNAPTPPAFCMALRRHIEGGLVRDVRQHAFDRILTLDIESRQPDGEVTVRLIAELMGKHSNLILLSPEGVILEAAKRITRRVNRVREVLPGLPYQPPPEQTGRIDPFAPDAVARGMAAASLPAERDGEALARALLGAYAGMSPFLAQELAARALVGAPDDLAAGLEHAWSEVFGAVAEGRLEPVLMRDSAGRPAGAYPIPSVQIPAGQQERVSDLNAALDTSFTIVLARAEFAVAAGHLRAQIDHQVRRLERQRQSIARTLAEAKRAEAHKQAGELLLANLWRIQPGDSSITVQDYYDPALPDRAIALNPRLSAQENAEAYFRRYRKARDGETMALERDAQAETTLRRLNEAAAQLETLATEEAVRTLRTELEGQQLLRGEEEGPSETRPMGGQDFQGHKIRRYTTPEGYEIYVGETATANDYLTTRIAASNDIWLHVRAAASAHVVIRTHNRPEAVPRSVLERAALLCAQHSGQKHSALVPVDYTLKKYVRKPRGAKPGSVLIQHEKTLHVTP